MNSFEMVQERPIPEFRLRPVMLWRWWMTPRSTNRDTVFRERVMRVTLIGLLVIILISFLVAIPWLSAGEADTASRFATQLGVLLFIVITGAFLNNGRLVPAAWMLLSVFIFSYLTSALDANYWTTISLSSVVVFTVYAQLVLDGVSLQISRLMAVFLVFLPLLGGFTPSDQIDDILTRIEPGFVTIFSFIGLGLVMLLLGVLRYEFDSRLYAIQELVANLEQRVAARTAELAVAKEEAEMARDQAVQADRVKSQFLSSMSHELRTPLNSILAFSELMAMGTFGDVNDEQRDYLQKMLLSGRHLLSLINDVLDITKIQSGMMKLFLETDFDIPQEMNDIATGTAKLLELKPVDLVLDVDHAFPPLVCDKRRIRQVLLNLVSNAVKFTEEGTITLSAKAFEDRVLFAVIDTGPGISEEAQQIIFEPFIQTETGIKHAGGTGLGLPISKRLVEAHEGTIWVESSPGEGAAFYVEIPFRSGLVVDEMTSLDAGAVGFQARG